MTRKFTFLILALLALICGPFRGGVLKAQTYTISSTPLTTVSNGDIVVWGTSNTNLAKSVASNWIYLSETTSEWIYFKVVTTENGFYLQETSSDKYIYSSADKKVELNSTNKTLLTITNKSEHSNIVYGGSSIGYYTLNSTGIRPYKSNLYTDAHLYLATVAPTASLGSIVVSGTAADLWTADEFSHEGITVMANWDEGDPTDVTNACEYSGYDMTSAGEQTVTVSYTAGEVTKSDTYTVTVNTIGNTQDEPYTVAQAKALIDAGNGLNEEVYVEGIICQVDSYNPTYHSITYWISADGTTTDKFEVYGGLNAEDQDPFSSKDDLTVGYHAIVKGTIQKFNSTYEFSQNSRLVSYTPPVTQLPTPTGLNVSNLSMNGATLSWDAVEHASSYTVYVTGINYEKTFEPTTNSIVLDRLTPGTTYLWTVKAIGDEVTYLDSDESELADFTTPITVIYNINFEAQQTGGTIEFYPEQAAAGEEVIAIATAANHYSFTQWNFSPAVTIYDGEDTDYNIIFIMPASDVTVSATFTEDPKYTVAYAKGGDDVTGEDPEPVSYYENDEVTLEENPYTRTGYTFFKWEVKDADENTQYLDENATFVMPASDVTVTPYWDEKDQYTVTYKSLGETIAIEQVYEGDLCTNVPTVTNIPTGWTIFGWTTGSANQTTTAPEPFDPATNPVIEDIILNAVFTKTEGETSWDETELDDLTSSDVFVITGTNANGTYSMSNDKGTSSAPTATSVTIVNGQITTEVADSQKWNISGNAASGYVFYPDGITTKWLYCINENNGVRVGTGDAKNMTITDGYLTCTETKDTRYIGIYNSADWRCYTSKTGSSNIKDQTFAYYKLNTGTTYYTTVAPASEYAIAIDGNIEHGTIEVENALTAAAAGTEITLIVTPEEHYSLAANSLTVTGESSATVEVTPVPGEVIKYTFVMPAEAVTITAQFTENPKFTVSCYANGTSVSTEQVYAGVMQLPVSVTAPNGYTFVGWTNQQISVVAESATYFSSYNVTGNVDLYAVFAIAEGGGDAIYAKVTEEPDDWSGDYLLVYEGENDAVAWTGADESNCYVEVTIANGEIAGTEGAAVLTIAPMDGGYSIQVNEGRYIGQDKYDNGIKFSNDAQLNTISLDDNNAVITAEGANNQRPTMRYNKTSGQDRFRYYKSGQQSVQLYKYSAPSTTFSNFCTSVTALYGNLAEAATEANTAYYISAAADVPANKTATINGVLGNADASLLIINDGGQLIHHNAGVAATFQKNITGYGENTQTRDGYYLIANPTDNTTVANLTNNNYDLYTFDGAADLEWINMKSLPVVANDGIGYLYANSAGVTLGFAGEIIPAGSTDINLNYANKEFGGFNLIGNPYACNAYVGKSFYVIDGTELELSKNNYVAPCEGFFVEASETDRTVALNTVAPKAPASALSLTVSQNRGNVIDRAIVSFNGRSNLHKFMLNPAHTNISLAKGGENFAAVSTEAEGEMPVNFKAEKNGTYTITVNTENVDAEYLHLIDNMTGMDTDLLSTSSYTFDAKTSDYASRFKLVFGVKNENTEAELNNFAYISNGELIISNEGRATLQVIDVMGRIISSEEINGEARISTNGLTAGLYILNLNGNVQKIVVR